MESGFLAEKEVHRIRPLWEKVFTEDSKAFTDYYFENRAEHNLVFTREDGEQIVSMLHLVPYLTGDLEPVCYIVGVATDEAYRRKGLMGSLMEEALHFLWEEGHTFTYLMPANPAYYTPYQFVYIYDKPEWKLNETCLPAKYLDKAALQETGFHLLVKEKGNLRIRTAGKNDMESVAEFANTYLKRHADCYMYRNRRYYSVLKQELIAENGNLFLIEKNECLCGILAYTKEKEKPGLQEVMLSDELASCELVLTTEKKPAIMGRVINAEEWLNCLECREKLDVLLRINDDKIDENNGIYRLHCQSGGGKLRCKKVKEEQGAMCQVSIEALTSFCFGYEKAKNCFTITEGFEKETLIKSLEQIKVKERIFINEIV